MWPRPPPLARAQVAASKLRGAQTRMEASRPFVGSSPAALKEALDVTEATSEKHFFLPISSDKVRAHVLAGCGVCASADAVA